MPRGASTVYTVSMPSRRLTIKRMRINDQSFMRAQAGEDNYQKSVAMAFRNCVIKEYGFDPGYIEYLLLQFTALASVPPQP